MAKVVIEFEGQQHRVEEEIAADDKRLRELLSTVYPDMANSVIERKPGEIIRITKRAGPKGSTPLEALIDAPEEINPALSMCRRIQRMELMGQLNYEQIDALSREIEEAIELGTESTISIRKTLQLLQSCQPTTGPIPHGF